MSRIIFSITFLLFTFSLMAQKPTPVKWSFDQVKNEDGTRSLKFTADMDKDWVIYGLTEHEDGPIATSFTFDEGDYKLKGELNSITKPKVSDDELFMITLEKYSNQAEFEQVVEITPNTKLIKGYLTFMTCDGSRCLPPEDIEFSFDID